jgi:hypothetical protein
MSPCRPVYTYVLVNTCKESKSVGYTYKRTELDTKRLKKLNGKRMRVFSKISDLRLRSYLTQSDRTRSREHRKKYKMSSFRVGRQMSWILSTPFFITSEQIPPTIGSFDNNL